MKKKTKEEKDRFDISLNINIDNVDSIINLAYPYGIPHTMSEIIPMEVNDLAMYIAKQLDDVEELQFHIKKVRKHSRDTLIEILKHVLAKPQKEISTTRKQYYNYLVGLYERTGKLPRT